MYTLVELNQNQCRYAVTNPKAQVALHKDLSHAKHYFCGDPVRPGKCYCERHFAKCYRGEGKDWQELAMMMATVETTIVGTGQRTSNRDVTPRLDQLVNGERNDAKSYKDQSAAMKHARRIRLSIA